MAKIEIDEAILFTLLDDAYQDEVAPLRLRRIRDTQAPRFEALKKSHPEIYKDFMAARTGPHETLLANRRRRVQLLTSVLEGGSG
jgi:hypothetical protein